MTTPFFNISPDLAEWLDTRPGSRSVARLGTAWAPRYPETAFQAPVADPADVGAGGEGETARALLADATGLDPEAEDSSAGASIILDSPALADTAIRLAFDVEVLTGPTTDPYGRVFSVGRLFGGAEGFVFVVTDSFMGAVRLTTGEVAGQSHDLDMTGRFQGHVSYLDGMVTFHGADGTGPLRQIGDPVPFDFPAPAPEVIGIDLTSTTLCLVHAGQLANVHGFSYSDAAGPTRFDPRDPAGWTLTHATVVDL